jgi:hypothetical protein
LLRCIRLKTCKDFALNSPAVFSKFRIVAIFVISDLETDWCLSGLFCVPNFTCLTPFVHQLPLSPEVHSWWSLWVPPFELQDLIRRCKNLDRKNKNENKNRAVQEWP